MCMCSLIMAHVWRSVLCSTMGVEGTELRLSGLVASDYALASLKQLTLPLTWQEFIQDHCFEDRSLWWGIGASSHQSRIRSLSAHSRAFSLKHWWNPGAMNLISSGFRPPCLHLSFTFSSLPLFFFLSPESVFFRNCFPCPDCSLTSTHLLY